MGVKLSIESEETPRQAALRLGGVLLLAGFCLIVGILATLALAHLIEFGFNQRSLGALDYFWVELLNQPGALWRFYGRWWEIFLGQFGEGSWRGSLWLPLAAPLPSAVILTLAFVRSSYSFSLWYLLHHHFARQKDIEKMGLTGGQMTVLGKFHDQILGLTRPASVLCFGEAGGGKTSSVAIPSILRSDDCCILAVDNSGTLARYTSGYRAKLGKVFYFNWDLTDEPEKGSYYPRWNPLSGDNLPPKGEKRDRYLKFLAEFLQASEKEPDSENYWEWLSFSALYAFLQFMTAKLTQAEANDYFLNQLLERKRLSKADKDILLSYYALMAEPYRSRALALCFAGKMNSENYIPVGSWEGIAPAWQGKELCLAMLADWLVGNYFENRSETAQGFDWKDWLESLITEAYVFNYGQETISGLQQLAYLSKKQRQIVLPMVLKPLRAFRHPAVRERTGSNDFNLNWLRGIKNDAGHRWEPVTIYCTANTRSTKLVNRLFMEVMLRHSLSGYKFRGPFQLLSVIDDVGQMMEVRTLRDAVSKGPRHRLSTLLLCNSLNNLKSIYGKEALEDLVTYTSYKIILGDDNHKLSRQLDKLAVFGSRAVQIPQGERRWWAFPGRSNAAYYHKIAKELKARRRLNIATRGWQLLLAEGFYHCPALLKNLHFLKEESFKAKALLPASYFLDGKILAARNLQDDKVPETNLGAFDDDTDVALYMRDVYDQVVLPAQDKSGRREVLAEDLTSRWSSGGLDKDKTATTSVSAEGDWWLEEEAFSPPEKENPGNPFAKK